MTATHAAAPDGDPFVSGAPVPRTLPQRVAGAAARLAVRRLVLMVIAAVTAAAVTRMLGPVNYGEYGSAIATWTILTSAADFGFSLVIGRDLARTPSAYRETMRAAYQVGLMWTVPLALVLAGLAVGAGISSHRGQAMLFLAPSLVAFGLTPARALFTVLYDNRAVVRVDIVVAVVQSALVIAVAAAGLGAPAVAAVVSATTVVNLLAVWLLARARLRGEPRGTPYGRRRFMRLAAPLGLLSLMTQAYLILDLAIIGWYVTGGSVGDYAAASKILMIFTGVAGLITAAALPAFSSTSTNPKALETIVTRVWHWLVVSALPVFVGLGVFAPLVVHVALGSQYGGAVTLLRVLSLAGIVSVLSNFLGTLMVATNNTRTLFIQNALALTLNFGGNVLLLPRVGVIASAWLTAATEVLVCVGALLVMVRRVDFRRALGVSGWPVFAMGVAGGVGLVIPGPRASALVASAVVFAAIVTLTHAWPDEFTERLPLWVSRREASS